MSKIWHIDFSPGDWIGGTLGMTLEEEGLYIRLVARIYSFGEMLDDDPKKLAKLCGVRPQVMRRLLARLKLLGKFHETGGKLVSNRCETELKLARNRLNSARFNGAKGGRNKHLAEPGGTFSVKANTNTNTSKKDSEETGVSSGDAPAAPPPPPDPVKELFRRGLAILGGEQHRSLLGKMRKNHGDEAVLQAILACEREQPSEPVSFFLGCLKRSPPAGNGGNGNHPGTYRPGPLAALAEGTYNAAEDYIRRRREADLGPDIPPLKPLLGRQ